MTTLQDAIAAHLGQRWRHGSASRRPLVPAEPTPRHQFRILKVRIEDDAGLVAVTWSASDGRTVLGVLEVNRSIDGNWQVDGGSTAIENNAGTERRPWFNAAGGWAPAECWAAGRVNGSDVYRVRMLDASGQHSAEDIVDNGIALVRLTGAYRNPCTLELYNAQGALLGTQVHAPPDISPPPTRDL